MPGPAKIVVTTPTGHVGSRVVRLLLQAGVRPTLFVRRPDKLDRETRALVDVVEGDQLDAEDVVRATEGAGALFWVNPPVREGDPVAAWAEAGAVVARAIEQHGISRTVFQSSIGAEKRHGVGQIDGLARTEEALDAAPGSVTHLRCGGFYTNLLRQLPKDEDGLIEVATPVDLPMPWVDPRDIGEVAAARLLDDGWSGRQVQGVYGPEDLSWEQMVGVINRVGGRRLRVEQVPDGRILDTMLDAGMERPVAEGLLGMQTGLRDDYVQEIPRTLLTTTPTTLGQWVLENLRA